MPQRKIQANRVSSYFTPARVESADQTQGEEMALTKEDLLSSLRAFKTELREELATDIRATLEAFQTDVNGKLAAHQTDVDSVGARTLDFELHNKACHFSTVEAAAAALGLETRGERGATDSEAGEGQGGDAPPALADQWKQQRRDSSDWRCSRTSEESVCCSHVSMGADLGAVNPDFRVPGKVTLDNGLDEGVEEEIDDATEENRRGEEQTDAGEQRGEGRAGNFDVPTQKTGPVKEDNARRRAPTATSQEGRG
ncbi:hypothetical protein NDU88_006115 [Pleurodeles waltl]|uniref:Uncharacterized protein n=1 Tax=Pleurodeles waltl TaxID=8319 RepID=A0AAV7VNZ4_PLEWA|nr:hypothetical protein NDU88_006115 [Pleurodeles waltl]